MITSREKSLFLWLPAIGSLYETKESEDDKVFYQETKPFKSQETLKTVFKICYTDTNKPNRTFLPPGKRFYLNNIEICQNIVAILEISFKMPTLGEKYQPHWLPLAIPAEGRETKEEQIWKSVFKKLT